MGSRSWRPTAGPQAGRGCARRAVGCRAPRSPLGSLRPGQARSRSAGVGYVPRRPDGRADSEMDRRRARARRDGGTISRPCSVRPAARPARCHRGATRRDQVRSAHQDQQVCVLGRPDQGVARAVVHHPDLHRHSGNPDAQGSSDPASSSARDPRLPIRSGNARRDDVVVPGGQLPGMRTTNRGRPRPAATGRRAPAAGGVHRESTPTTTTPARGALRPVRRHLFDRAGVTRAATPAARTPGHQPLHEGLRSRPITSSRASDATLDDAVHPRTGAASACRSP